MNIIEVKYTEEEKYELYIEGKLRGKYYSASKACEKAKKYLQGQQR